MNNKKLEKFAELINNSSKTVFFGGAGVSTESGVKDYRSEDGLYNTVREYGVSPETILSHSFFVSKPDVFYDFYYKYFLEINVEPNTAHIVLAEMEKQGKLSSKNVIELHGTTAVHYCMECGKPYPLEKLKSLKGKVPHCEKCGGLVRPDVVLYEEPLKENVVEKAISEISTADLLIIGGTSLAVYPAAMYIRYFRGSNIVLINKGKTDLDSSADLVFRDSIGQLFGDFLFREMRRIKQQLSKEECEEILARGKTGVLAVLGDDGYPYTVPINYYYTDGKIYLHCAKTGHKLDAIKKEQKVSFCVVARDDILQEKYTTLFKSVVAFGKAEILTDENEMRSSVTSLAEKYCTDCLEGIPAEVERGFGILCMIKINIEHMTGKQGKELLKEEIR